MCEQCSAGAIHLGEPIPGFFLVQATQDGFEMHSGDYGLVEMNSPFFIFPMKPTPDPCAGMSDEEVGKFCEVPEQKASMMAWLEIARDFEDLFVVDPKTGWRFVEACRKVGYTDEDGSVAIWFFHNAGVVLETK